jgi:AcrR family transcriptional regulator
MRADARRNRERLLDAAVEVILEVGGDPPRDAVATRAEVGIGTLYRHFPDQQSLLDATARRVLDRAIAAGEASLEECADGVAALRRYLHAAVDAGLGAVSLIHPLLHDPGWPERRRRAEAVLARVVDRARRAGHLRPDVSEADIGFAIIRFCRPLAIGRPLADERAIAHRHIDVFVDGLTGGTGS